MKKYLIFAGVNDAGKTTLYQASSEYKDLPRVNMDEIVRRLGSNHEKKSTGISKILRELKRNGSLLPEFETDADRTYMIRVATIVE